MRTKTAFTLIELLIVVAVIAIIAGVAFPMLSVAREKGRQTECVSNLAQLGKALHLYADDWNGYIPPFNNLNPPTHPGHPALLVQAFVPYLRAPAVWHCPSDPYIGRKESIRGAGSNFSHEFGSYATNPFVPPVLLHFRGRQRLSDKPWRLDAPGSNGDRPPSDYGYLFDWFMQEIPESVSHHRRGNILAFDGRVTAALIPALGPRSPAPRQPE